MDVAKSGLSLRFCMSTQYLADTLVLCVVNIKRPLLVEAFLAEQGLLIKYLRREGFLEKDTHDF